MFKCSLSDIPSAIETKDLKQFSKLCLTFGNPKTYSKVVSLCLCLFFVKYTTIETKAVTLQQVWSSSDGVQQGGAFGIVQVSENLIMNCVYQFDLNNPLNQSNYCEHWRMESYLLYRENSWLNGVHIHVGSQV